MNYQRECRKILEHYGQKMQEMQAAQELNELQGLLLKRPDQRIPDTNGVSYREHIIEEIADSLIMIEQIKAMHGITSIEIECETKRKIGRQMKRMEADA